MKTKSRIAGTLELGKMGAQIMVVGCLLAFSGQAHASMADCWTANSINATNYPDAATWYSLSGENLKPVTVAIQAEIQASLACGVTWAAWGQANVEAWCGGYGRPVNGTWVTGGCAQAKLMADTHHQVLTNKLHTIIGDVNGVSLNSDGSATITGWSCSLRTPGAVTVHLYLDGQAGTGFYVTNVAANVSREAAVGNTCLTPGANAHGYSITLSSDQVKSYQNKAIYVHGINPWNGPNNLLQHSGSYAVPAYVAPTPSPTPTATVTSTPSPTPSPTVTVTPSPSPSTQPDDAAAKAAAKALADQIAAAALAAAKGCTDPKAANYDRSKLINDGSCHYNTTTGSGTDSGTPLATGTGTGTGNGTKSKRHFFVKWN